MINNRKDSLVRKICKLSFIEEGLIAIQNMRKGGKFIAIEFMEFICKHIPIYTFTAVFVHSIRSEI